MARFKSRGEAIKELRKKSGITQEELAKMLDTTKQTIYKYETGVVTNIPSDKIEAMSEIFHVSPAVIMGWDEPPAPKNYYFEVAAGPGKYSDGTPDGEIDIRLKEGEMITRVRGTSMEPTLVEGDYVVVRSQVAPDHPKQICLVKENGDEATLKRVEIKPDGILLIGDNVESYTPRFYTAEEVETLPVTIIGVAVRLRRDL